MCYPDYQIDVYKTMSGWWELPDDKLNKSMEAFVKGGGEKGSKAAIDAYQAVYDTINLAIDNEYKAPPTEEMAKVSADMGKLESETFNAIVVGNQPVDAFDEFVTEWKAIGGDVWTAGVNDWYKSTQ